MVTLPGKEDVPTSADLAHVQMLPWEVTLVKVPAGRGFDRLDAQHQLRTPQLDVSTFSREVLRPLHADIRFTRASTVTLTDSA